MIDCPLRRTRMLSTIQAADIIVTNSSNAEKVCSSVMKFDGRPYDFRGAVRSAISSGCSNVKRLLPATMLIEVAESKALKS